MELRAYAVTHYEKEFGDCLGFNYNFDGFIDIKIQTIQKD